MHIPEELLKVGRYEWAVEEFARILRLDAAA